jgi:hypothetical protein
MKRFAKVLLVPAGALLVAATLVLGPPAVAQNGPKPPPPLTNAYGKTLAEWLTLWATWNLGGDQAGQVGRVVFLPQPGSELIGLDPNNPDLLIYEGSLDLTLRPGTPLVISQQMYGETYLEDFPDDDPQILVDLGVVETSETLVRLDGVPLMQGTGAGLKKFLVGPVYFDEPIFYDEPQPRVPNVNAVGAIWFQAIGFVYPPMAVGEHTLEIVSTLPAFNVEFRYTWHITVAPR